MSIPLIPWECHVFPKEIQAELRRRAINRSFNPIDGGVTTWTHNKDDGSEWNAYKGPMTAWVRLCSNGVGLETRVPLMEGFVMHGGKNFYDSYGFNRVSAGGVEYGPNQTIIGYTPEGVPHIIEDNLVNSQYPIHVPNPEIEKISATIQKELLRRVRIDWTCFSFKQLEYMTPYFLVPGISATVEWGWNHFNPLSLLDLKNTSKLAELYNNPYPLYTDNILSSKGNYEVLFGIVTNFEWSIDGNKIKCVTEITSKDRIWAGQVVNMNLIEQDSKIQADVTTKGESSIKILDSLKKFVNDYVESFKDFVNYGPEDADAVISKVLNKVVYNTSYEEVTVREEVPASSTFGAAVNTGALPTPSYRLVKKKVLKEEVKKPGFKDPLVGFVEYLKSTRPDDYQDYLFGVFYGRDETTTKKQIGSSIFSRKVKGLSDPHANSDYDFDGRSRDPKNFWINLGLIVEIINYHSTHLQGVADQPFFRVDIDDCVIGGHPNLISSDGNILLIPNSLAPKYFSGQYGYAAYEIKDEDEYNSKMNLATHFMKEVKAGDLDPNEITPSLKYSNYRLQKILNPMGGTVKRDNIDYLINFNRYKYASKKSKKRFEFPFNSNYVDDTDTTPRNYQAYYTGFLKNLYFNVTTLKEILNQANVKTFDDVYKEMFNYMNLAASQFWDLKLVGSTGRSSTSGLATMKIIDTKMTQYTSNGVEDIFTFDYYAADSLLQSINFRPMLSNAQAIRTIYAQTDVNNNKKVVVSGQNELLDYKFHDRLFVKNKKKQTAEHPRYFTDDSFRSTMGKAQAVQPPDRSFQMTTGGLDEEGNEAPIIYRLAIPKEYADILGLMLDDNDQAHNPRYTGIMPGIQAEFTIQGIAGLRTFAMFRVRGLPEPYSEDNIIFRIVNVNDTVQNGQWITTIIAGVIPLRGYFRSRLGLPQKKEVVKK